MDKRFVWLGVIDLLAAVLPLSLIFGLVNSRVSDPSAQGLLLAWEGLSFFVALLFPIGLLAFRPMITDRHPEFGGPRSTRLALVSFFLGVSVLAPMWFCFADDTPVLARAAIYVVCAVALPVSYRLYLPMWTAYSERVRDYSEESLGTPQVYPEDGGRLMDADAIEEDLKWVVRTLRDA